MASKTDTKEQVVRELGAFLEPVVEAGNGGPSAIFRLLRDAGVGDELQLGEVEKLVSIVGEELADPLTTVHQSVLVDEAELSDVPTVIEAVVEIHGGITKIDDLSFESPELDEVGSGILDYLVEEYLESRQYLSYNVCIVLGVLGQPRSSGAAEFRPGKLLDLFNEPGGTMLDTYTDGDAGGALDYDLISFGLGELFSSLDIDALPEPIDREAAQALSTEIPGSLTNDQNAHRVAQYRQYRFPLVRGGGFAFGVNLIPVPSVDTSSSPPEYEGIDGFALQPYGKFEDGWSGTFGENDQWTFSTTLSISESDWVLGALLQSGQIKTKALSKDGSTLPSLKARGEIARATGQSGSDKPLVGSSDGTNLTATELGIAGLVGLEDDEFVAGVELPSSFRLVIKPSGGFLEQVFPENITSEFDLMAGWSNKKGLYFEGGVSLEIPIPVHEQLGPLTIKEIFISLAADTETGEITVQAAASASVNLGPLVGTVTRIGLETDLSFPENRDGNMGVVDLELGFKPPDGVGLDIEAGPVKGGGYLAFDPENERYAGTGQLTVPSGLSISVVGLITTELPDGSDGFSMMLIIAGEFDAVQLGFGFTLSGVGGLLGINRKFRKQPLQDIVRQGNLDSVLFPEDVVENAQRIISDVREIFPPTRGSHVFGPMLKIGWGTPTIIAASVGVVLEIPSFRIAILGNIEMALPSLEVERPEGMPEEVPFPPIQVNLDVVGIIDIPGKSLSLDASLYDSRIMQWTMSGDMALRSSWGERSVFLLSIGGFNPRYEPPSGFPELDRVTVSLDVPGGQPVIDFTGYLAVTSNTFQVGAQVNAELEVGPLYVYGGLGFDALFRFNPFSFIFDFFAHFGVEFKSFELSVGVDGTISGPSPFHIRGTVSVSVGPFDVSAKIDVTLGKDAKTKQLPTAEVLPELVAALNEPKNWDAQLPGDGNGVATLRSAKSAAAREQAKASAAGGAGGAVDAPSPVIAHPLGTLTVRQTVVPFNYAIEKFGEARPTTYDEFRIAGVTVGGVADHDREAFEDEFAPAAFRKMDDAEKLDTPDFVDLEAGTTAGDVGMVVGGEGNSDDATAAAFTYEEAVYDEKHDNRGTPLSEFAAAKAGVGHTAFTAHELSKGKRGVQPEDEGLFGVSEGDDDDGGLFGVGGDDFVVVEMDTLTPVVTDFAQYGGDGDEDDEGSGFASIADSAVAEDVRPGLHVGTSKGRAQVELQRYANESGVDERDLQVVRTTTLEDDE